MSSFDERLARCEEELKETYLGLYHDEKAYDYFVGMLRRCADERPQELRDLDEQRLADPGWYTGNDMLEGKLTLPVIYALNSNADPKAHANAAKVKGGTATQEDIQWLIEFAKTNGGIDYAYSVMDDYRTEARQILSAYTNVPVREALQQYVDFVIDRNK